MLFNIRLVKKKKIHTGGVFVFLLRFFPLCLVVFVLVLFLSETGESNSFHVYCIHKLFASMFQI